MKAQSRSWRYFGLIAFAFVAGAVRMEEERIEPKAAFFFVARQAGATESLRCDERLDAAWIGQCTGPQMLLAPEH